MSTVRSRKLRRRKLFVWGLIAVVCIWLAGLAWLQVARQRAQRRQAAVAAIRDAGGRVFGPPSWRSRVPSWFDRLLYHVGVRRSLFSATVHSIQFPEGEVSDEHLKLLREFPDVRQLVLYATEIEDDDLKHLAGLKRLEELQLSFTQVGDEGLRRIKHLPYLRELHLSGTAVTDRGLKHLTGLHNLRKLYLGFNSVGDTGLAHLGTLSNLEELTLGGTEITGAGLSALGGLTNLKDLLLDDTAIDNDSLAALSGLTNLEVVYLGQTIVNDDGLRHLEGLWRLRHINLNGTRVSDAAWRLWAVDQFRALREPQRIGDAERGARSLIKAVQARDLFRLARAVADARDAPPDTELVSGLAALLHDEDPAVRKLAAYALGRVAGASEHAITALVATLEDHDAGVRWHAAAALGHIGPPAAEAAPALTVALDDEDLEVRICAGVALWRITAQTQPAVGAIVDAWRQDPHAIMPITDTLAEMAPAFQESVPALRGLAASGPGWVAWPALQVLGRMEREGVQHLMDGLDNPETRMLAGKWLGERGPEAKKAVPALLAALGDQRPEIRTYIAEALGKIGVQDASVLSALAETYEDSTGYQLRHVRKAALEALIALDPTAAATRAALSKARHDKHFLVRRVAEEALHHPR